MGASKSSGIITHWPTSDNAASLPTAYDLSREKNNGVVTAATLAADGYIDKLEVLSHIDSDPAGAAANDYAATRGMYL